jgi:hypothetical protein
VRTLPSGAMNVPPRAVPSSTSASDSNQAL